jgi:methylmalonyl-CoA epimerase
VSGATIGIAGLAHVGIAVRALEPAIERWTKALGFTLAGEETIESMGLRLAFLRAGDLTIELIEPTRADSAVARFLEKRGEGIHHLSFAVPDIEAGLARAAASGVEFLVRSRIDRPDAARR